MSDKPTTVAQYLASLPDDRRKALEAVRKLIRQNLDSDYEEGVQYGMIGYYVPHRVYPAGYHCDPRQPLPFVCLASQKNYMSLYMMCIYGDHEHAQWFQTAWAKTGKRLNMGKSCIRFKKVEDLALDVIGEAIRRVPAKKYIEHYEAVMKPLGGGAKKKAPAAKAKTAKPAARTKASSRSGNG